MDTISSRESNINYLPLAGVIVAAIALILAVVAFMKLSSLKNEIADMKTATAKIDGIETQANQGASALQVANETKANLYNVAKGANDSFKTVSDQLTDIKGRLDKIETARPVRVAAPAGAPAGGGAAQPAVAGADEYIVKGGDTGAKIAAAAGVKLGDLIAVNPDVNWNKMHVGQKIKLPKK